MTGAVKPGRREDVQLEDEPQEGGAGRKRQQACVAERLVMALLHGFHGPAIGQTPAVFVERGRSGRVGDWHAVS